MPRPTAPVTFRLSPEEIDFIDSRKEQLGLNRTQVVRQVLRNSETFPRPTCDTWGIRLAVRWGNVRAPMQVTADLLDDPDWANILALSARDEIHRFVSNQEKRASLPIDPSGRYTLEPSDVRPSDGATLRLVDAT